jgi:ATP-dependent DNA helicase RecG
MAEKLGVNIKTVKRDIEKLKAENIIKRQGGRKAGYWEIVHAN